ncbi:lysozyme C-1-like [Scyliorhinus canicula]|uniref:lysozyme C-1-like n=1 Tax=Scyliorhinus canicula TaxID=7830 RepID=UPI0018F2B21F|nr:lysozyme C-1-like [Scyliorhinus canicula]
MKTLLILSTLLLTASTKIFDRCELARILKNAGLDGYHGYRLNDWLCTAFYESAYNSAALHLEWRNGKILSMDCGMFQINSFWWCLDDDTPVTKRNCGTSCSAFLDDDLTDDIKCVKSIVNLHPGMVAWVAWTNRCNGQNIDHFANGCGT